MKRTLTIAVGAVVALLLFAWIGFETFLVEPGSVEPSASRESKPEGNVVGTVPSTDESVPAAAADSPSETSSARSFFDWRGATDSAVVDAAAESDRRPVESPPSDKRETSVGNAVRDAEPANRTKRVPAGMSGSSSVRAVPPTLGERPIDQPRPSAEEERRDDPSEDIRPPELEWIRFTPAEVAAGAESILSASAVDDLAGVRDFVGRISSPSGNAHQGFALSRNEAAGSWETVMRIPEKAESGRWQITWLRITDKANNSRDERWGAGGAPPGSFLLVSSNEGDGEPPVLHSVALDRQTMAPGETVQVMVDVSDERSSVRFVSGTFQSPSGKAWAPFTASEQGGVWSGPVTVPEDGECGEWTLRRVTAIDEANNQATWGTGDERIAGITFYRSFSGSCDSEPPVLTRLELSPKSVANESASQIQVAAFIDDVGSGVASASGFVMVADQSAVTPQRVHFVLRKSSEAPGSPWVGTIEIPQHSMAGRWEIRALRISDQARNQKTYGPSDPSMADGWFHVE